MNIKKFLTASLVSSLLLCCGCGQDTYNHVVDTENQQQKSQLIMSKEIIFIPLGDFPASRVEELINYYHNKFNLNIKTVPALQIRPSAIDLQRHQLIAEEAIDIMQWGYPRLSGDPRPVMIGLTDQDMFIRQKNFQFTFSWRQQGRFAVVSDARMGVGTLGISPEVVNSRLRKMVTKDIGIMYYEMYPSDDPHSVMYGDIGGVEDLDKMGEDF